MAKFKKETKRSAPVVTNVLTGEPLVSRIGADPSAYTGDKPPEQISEVIDTARTLALAKKPAMPIADDEATQQARRRSIAAQRARRGRASTVLTQSETLG